MTIFRIVTRRNNIQLLELLKPTLELLKPKHVFKIKLELFPALFSCTFKSFI